MAFSIPNSIVSDTDGVTIDAGFDCIVRKGVSIVGLGNAGIYGGTSHNVFIYGDVYGIGRGLELGQNGRPAADSVFISSEGSVSSSGYGIKFFGNGNLVNHGSIQGQYSAVYSIGSGLISVRNFGTMNAISHESSGKLNVYNYGLIVDGINTQLTFEAASKIYNRGTIDGSIILTDPADTITNRGLITGKIDFGFGDDILDNRGGTTEGTIFFGADNDTFRPGVGIEVADGGSEIDTLDFSLSGSVQAALDDSIVSAGVAKDDTYTGFENMIGSKSGNDILVGDGGANVLAGLGGADKLVGQAGADTLSGGFGNDTLEGGEGVDSLSGDAGDDSLLGGGGNDTISGGDGNDTLNGGDGADTLNGNAGNDTLVGGLERDIISGGDGTATLNGGDGDDDVDGGAGDDALVGGLGNDSVLGGDGNDTLDGGAGTDFLFGDIGNDTLVGGAGNDQLSGGDGDDFITGGAGADAMVGGAGADRFIFLLRDFVGLDQPDRITGFSQAEQDKIDLFAVDASSKVAADQAFTFIGTAAFSKVAGQLRFEQVGTDTYVTGDTNGDGVKDFLVLLNGTYTLTEADFVL